MARKNLSAVVLSLTQERMDLTETHKGTYRKTILRRKSAQGQGLPSHQDCICSSHCPLTPGSKATAGLAGDTLTVSTSAQSGNWGQLQNNTSTLSPPRPMGRA